MLKKEYEYFLANQEVLSQKYEGKTLIIKDLQVKGAFDTKIEALNWGLEHFERGTFLVQLCTMDMNALSNTFHSRYMPPVQTTL